MTTSILDRLEVWHCTKFGKPWLGPLTMTRMLAIAVLALALVVVFANVKVRQDQGQIWKANPDITEIAGGMSFSTADAPYFLGHAAAAEKGLSPASYEWKRSYPKNGISDQQPSGSAAAAERPLLSTLISWVAPSSSHKDLLTAGHSILLVSAGATALMIMVAFGALGYWLEGTVAALGGGLSSAYLVRSSFGRIDTDQLNLGLMYLMFGLVVMSSRSRNILMIILWCIAAGATARIFMAWYGKPELIWMAMGAYLWLLIFLQRNVRIIALCMLLFYALTPITIPNPFEKFYVLPHILSGKFIFPNVRDTITEVSRLSTEDILVSVAGSVEMGLVCLFGLTLWAVRHPVLAIGYGPLAGFALLNFFIGNRAVFYSAPICWFGAAFLISTAARFIKESISSHLKATTQTRFANSPVSIAAASLSFVIAWVNSPTDYLPRPSFPKPVLEGMLKLDTIATSDKSVVATWWDYGYASIFFNNLHVLHHGGSHRKPTSHLFAYALLSSSQAETKGILQFLASQGTDSLNEYGSKSALLAEFNRPAKGTVPDIYLVLTRQMTGWIKSISRLEIGI